MMDPQSAILAALYNRQPEEAHRLAESAQEFTVWERRRHSAGSTPSTGCWIATAHSPTRLVPTAMCPLGLPRSSVRWTP